MQRLVNFEDRLAKRECVKDFHGQWIYEGLYVTEASNSSCRQGWIAKVLDENEGLGKIKVIVVRNETGIVDSYLTEFEPSTNWFTALHTN